MISQTGERSELPLVSAVIPAYNCERYVARAIRSVLAQTYPSIECIVVDDGSTDRTASIAKSFGDSIRVIVQQNSGASAARNAGIEVARGRYIAFLDCDDYWLPNKIQLQTTILQNDPELVLVSSDLTWIDASVDPDVLDRESPPFDPKCLERCPGLDHLIMDPYLGMPTVVVDSEAVKRIGGFDTSLPIAEDVDFYLRLCEDRPYAILHLPLVRCQLRAGSLTTQLHGYACNLEVLERFVREKPDLAAAHESTIRSRRLAIYSEWARSHILRGQGGRARDVLRRSESAGRLPDYAILHVKSWFAPATHWLRQLWHRTTGRGA